jgi:hypothetical protein
VFPRVNDGSDIDELLSSYAEARPSAISSRQPQAIHSFQILHALLDHIVGVSCDFLLSIHTIHHCSITASSLFFKVSLVHSQIHP